MRKSNFWILLALFLLYVPVTPAGTRQPAGLDTSDRPIATGNPAGHVTLNGTAHTGVAEKSAEHALLQGNALSKSYLCQGDETSVSPIPSQPDIPTGRLGTQIQFRYPSGQWINKEDTVKGPLGGEMWHGQLMIGCRFIHPSHRDHHAVILPLEKDPTLICYRGVCAPQANLDEAVRSYYADVKRRIAERSNLPATRRSGEQKPQAASQEPSMNALLQGLF